MRTSLRWLAVAFAVSACQSADKGGSATDSASGAVRDSASGSTADASAPPEWTKTAVIYEINVRQYTPEGTFAALQKHLPRLKNMGVDVLWLMPVQPIGKLNRKGKLGSPYSVADYTAINAEYGTVADFKAFVDEAHRQGLKVILDWVANHSAFDHAWITEHRDWYVSRPDGSISNAMDYGGKETDWTDVAELNYDSPAMRRAMIGEMRWWVDSMGVDGFRSDVARGVPPEFWAQARRELRTAKPDLFLLAEGEIPELHQSFHMTYGWELHHLLNEIAQKKKPTSALDAYFALQDTLYPTGAFRMYFTSNHDENSWQGTEFERMGKNHLPAFVVAATVHNGMPLLYTGQEVSLNKRLRFFEKDTVDWKGPSLESFYRSMFELKESQEALWNGAWGGPQVPLKHDAGDRVYAFTRTKGASTVLVAVNFDDKAAKMSYASLPQPGDYTDWFSKATVPLVATGQLDIPANGYRVLVKK
jgi:alpha-amylase